MTNYGIADCSLDDEQLAKEYLSNISYYRLRAYTYSFQDNVNPTADHKFLRSDIHFSDIIDLYRFDRRLRSVMFNAIEKIEVAVRTKIFRHTPRQQGIAIGLTTEISTSIKRKETVMAT